MIEKGESVSTCLEMYREMQNAERAERAAEREMRKVEMEKSVRLGELEVREKELAQGGISSRIQKSGNIKSKLPKLQEGQDPGVF